ncbi:hypothetical protein FACS189472_12220 [Alphaproteobacteria bacterium]|nr:hypothetical protein FACS189472_12220 [Alphaproteobacteria bacterium]
MMDKGETGRETWAEINEKGLSKPPDPVKQVAPKLIFIQTNNNNNKKKTHTHKKKTWIL